MAEGRAAWGKVVGDNDIVFEDKKVVVFHDPVDEEHESERVEGEIRLTLLSKQHAHSIMDLGVSDEGLGAAILHGIQQAAYRMGLEKKGFEVRAHVYPPLQHRPEIAFKIRAGKMARAKPPTTPSAKLRRRSVARLLAAACRTSPPARSRLLFARVFRALARS